MNDTSGVGSALWRFARCPIRWRVAFGVYALILATLTHWPRLSIAGPVPRTDLFAHFGAFGLWAVLLAGARWFGSVASVRNLALCGVIGVVYAAIDELTQGIPVLGRHVAWSDWLANVGGIVLGLSVLALAQRARAGAERTP